VSIDVDTALFERWVAAGLNSSIAPLYPSDDVSAPEDAGVVPRASYFVTADPLQSESRGSRIALKTYMLEVWDRTRELVGTHVNLIDTAFINAERAGLLQMPESAGRIMATHYVDQGWEKVQDALFKGWIEISVQWRKPNATPVS